LSDLISAFVLVFAAMFPIVDPLGSAPIFLSLTADRTPEERTRLARDVAFNSFLMMLGSLLFGSEIIEFFGIKIPVVRVAGGLIIAWMGWELLNEGIEPPERRALNKEERPARIEGSFYPLTLPLTVGPGSIAVALTLGTQRPADNTLVHTAMLALAATASLLAIAVIVYLSYRFAAPIARFLGRAGLDVLVRLSAFILICIGFQIAWDGISSLLVSVGH